MLALSASSARAGRKVVAEAGGRIAGSTKPLQACMAMHDVGGNAWCRWAHVQAQHGIVQGSAAESAPWQRGLLFYSPSTRHQPLHLFVHTMAVRPANTSRRRVKAGTRGSTWTWREDWQRSRKRQEAGWTAAICIEEGAFALWATTPRLTCCLVEANMCVLRQSSLDKKKDKLAILHACSVVNQAKSIQLPTYRLVIHAHQRRSSPWRYYSALIEVMNLWSKLLMLSYACLVDSGRPQHLAQELIQLYTPHIALIAHCNPHLWCFRTVIWRWWFGVALLEHKTSKNWL